MKRVAILSLALTYGIGAKKYDVQIRKAVVFFQKSDQHLKTSSVVTLDFLIRNYNLNINISKARKNILASASHRERMMLRTLDSKQTVPELEIRVLKGPRSIMPTAVYCDIYPLPWDFLENTRTLALKHGGYAVTMGVFALAIIEWQNCKYDITNQRELQNTLAEKILEILKVEKIGSELWIECIQSLYLAGRKDLVTAELLAKLAKEQLANGSWQNDDNLTAKALWVFLLAEEPTNSPRRKQLIPKANK